LNKRLLIIIGAGVVLIIAAVVILNALSGPGEGPEATPVVKPTRTLTPSPTWTTFSTPRPLPVATVIPTADPFTLDSDGDFLPDGVEKVLGTDPLTHECAGSFQLDASILVILDSTLWATGDKALPAGSTAITEALRGMTSVVPTGVRVGVMAAGTAGSGKDCTSSLLAPVQPVSQQALRLKPEQARAASQRPLVQAFKDVPAAFAGIETGTRYAILVSRGAETCSGDPCAEARALKSGPLALTVDTIALAADAPGREALQCIADYTGGLFYQADNVEDFSRLWRAENERLSRWLTAANNVQENRMGCMRCMADIMNKFLKWARDTGFVTSQSKQYQFILDQLTRNLQC
jgi:hypothetical protein